MMEIPSHFDAVNRDSNLPPGCSLEEVEANEPEQREEGSYEITDKANEAMRRRAKEYINMNTPTLEQLQKIENDAWDAYEVSARQTEGLCNAWRSAYRERHEAYTKAKAVEQSTKV